MSKNKPLWEQDVQLLPIGLLVGVIGFIGAVVSVALLIMGSAKLWMFVFPVLALIGAGLAISSIIEHTKYVLGVNAVRDETDEEGGSEGGEADTESTETKTDGET